MKKPLAATLAITTALLALGRGPAHAVSTILQPDGVTSNLSPVRGIVSRVNNLINQSGLSQSYTSGVTPWNEVSNINGLLIPFFRGVNRRFIIYLASLGEQPQRLTFNLLNSGNRKIQSLALWNVHTNDGINRFELFADNDNDFNNGGTTLLGTFSAPLRELRIPTQSADIFSFTATRARYVHLNILSNYSGGGPVAINEIAFELVPFEFGPLPGIIGILTAFGINYYRRKNSYQLAIREQKLRQSGI